MNKVVFKELILNVVDIDLAVGYLFSTNG